VAPTVCWNVEIFWTVKYMCPEGMCWIGNICWTYVLIEGICWTEGICWSIKYLCICVLKEFVHTVNMYIMKWKY
jgi:hypothetical protein